MVCAFCNSPLTNVNAKFCESCGAGITLDSYPENKGVASCPLCGKIKPAASKYCTSCGANCDSVNLKRGIKKNAPAIVNGLLNVVTFGRYGRHNDMSTQKRRSTFFYLALPFIIVGCALAIGFVIIVIAALVAVLTPSSEYYFRRDEDTSSYTSSYTYSGYSGSTSSKSESTPADLSGIVFKKVHLDQMHELLSDLKPGDYVEITGCIDYCSSYSCDLVPTNFNKDNKDNECAIYFDTDEIGSYIDDNFVVNTEITVRCRVDTVWENINSLTVDGLALVEDTE